MASIVFTGGGTGGHVYPALALVPYLRAQGPEGPGVDRIFWIGSSSGMERPIVEAAGLEFFGIPSGKLRRYFSLRNFLDIFKVLAGFFASRAILKREKPALLFSKGGFVSVPPCAAAASLGIPVFTHESDYSPGLATRINARFAEKIFVPYKQTGNFFKPALRGKVLVTGNPIRREFQEADPRRGRAFLGLGGAERILLVLGGSLGAREINELVRDTLPELVKHYTVVHQTGEEGAGEFPGGDKHLVYPFIKEALPHVIAAAELVVCRCGAGTLWECASLRRPLVMIPLHGSGTRGDQVENARVFEEAGMGLTLRGPGSQGEQFLAAVLSLAEDGAKREAMGAAAARFAPEGGAGRIAGELLRRTGEAPAEGQGQTGGEP